MIQIKQKVSRVHKVALWLAVLAAIVIGGLSYDELVRQHTDKAPLEPLSAQNHTDLPTIVTSDKTPEQKRVYSVAPDRPRHLTIDSIGVSANILPMGVVASGALQAPETGWDVGWYDKSALPGAKRGAMLLDGHVNNTIGTPGVFFSLHELRAGDMIRLERGDGVELMFAVVTVEQKLIEQVDMAKMLESINPDKHGLNIITCGGTYDSTRKTYDQRVLVYTTQVE